MYSETARLCNTTLCQPKEGRRVADMPAKLELLDILRTRVPRPQDDTSHEHIRAYAISLKERSRD